MTTIAFDTLAFANKLKKGGVEAKSAEIQAEALSEIMKDLTKNQLVTKLDLRDVELALKHDLIVLKQEIYSFIVKTTIFTVTILGGLQTLFKFVH
jgi:hypothetical protein